MSVTHIPPFDLHGHVAIVTGANHGIGAATARVLAAGGASVLLTYLRLEADPDPGTPVVYAQSRGSRPDDVVSRIHAHGGRAAAVEADLADAESHGLLFDPQRSGSDRSTSW
jgi:3-oxoacyl-[acyl-carrier protein] reductase